MLTYAGACWPGLQVVTIYVGFATFPPPADGAKDNEEEEDDDEDLYDWFTFEQVHMLTYADVC
jgi:hypothetical protein